MLFIYPIPFLWLTSYVFYVNCACSKSDTKILIKDQLQTLEKTINMATGSCCCNQTPLKSIAFHAEIKSDRTYKGGSVWIYENVVTNEGNAYNPATGKFTVPGNGVYLFTWYTLSDPGKYSHAGLYVNGKIKGRQASNNGGAGNKWITSGSNIALALKKGDAVCIMDVHGWTAQIRGLFTSFGGVQIS